MKKSSIMTAVASALCMTAMTAIPAAALMQTNRNALSKGPEIGRDFETPRRERAKRPQRAAAGTPLPAIVASVYDYKTNTIGMYRLPDTAGGEMTRLSAVSSYYGGARGETLYYACDDGRFDDYWDTDGDPHGHRIQAYDTKTWEPVGTALDLGTYRAPDMTIQPGTGLAYAFCDYGSMMYNLYSIDLTTGEQTEHTGPGGTLFPEDISRAIAFAPDGTLYGVTRDGYFGTVDINTGRNSRKTRLNGINGDNRHNWTGDIDPDTGNFIFIYNVNDISADAGADTEMSRIYSINVVTGQMTLLADFPGMCITSMYIASDDVADGAPSAPEDVDVTFDGASLSGTVSFTMPSTLNDGTSATGAATWNIADGTETIATGQAAYGDRVTAPVTLTAEGNHNISVSVANDAGDGRKTRVTVWAGPDFPKAPANVKATHDETAGTFTVTWDPVTEGANGGFVNPDAVNYTVTRMPAGELVAESNPATTCTDTYTPLDIERVYYTVVASQGELSSEPASSDAIMSGAMALPYDMSAIDLYRRLDNWTVIDANEDGSTWETSYQGVRYSYNSANQGDDWAITPPIKSFAGCRYKVTASFFAYGTEAPSNFPERVEMKMGYAPTAEAMQTEVLAPQVIDAVSAAPATFEFDVVPDRDGTLFIGLHAISDADQFHLYIADLKIAAPTTMGAPAQVTGLKAEADRTGALRVTGSGTAPTVSVAGASIPEVSRIEVLRGETVVDVIENIAPGAEFTFADETIGAAGEYAYTAVAYNGDDAGNPCDPVMLFAGINSPGEVGGITIAETATDGMIRVTWEPAAADWQGYPLNGDVTYSVEIYPDNAYYRGNHTESGITGTEVTLTPDFADGRDHGMVYVKVNAVNSAGAGYAAKSDNIAIGRALPCPFGESFPNYTLEHPWGDGATNGPQIASISDDERALSFNQFNGWNRMMDQSFGSSSEASQDGDNGFAGMFGWAYAEDNGTYHEEFNELLSPKIDLSGLSTPMLTFHAYNWLNQNGPDMNRIKVEVICDGERNVLTDFAMCDLGNAQRWENVSVDLSDYAGKVISLVFTGTVKANGENGYNWILIDNIDIDDVKPVDIAVSAISAPVQAVPGEQFAVKAYVSNKGAQDIASYRASLHHNGKTVETREMGRLAFSRGTDVEFEYTLSVTDPVGNSFAVSVETQGDADAANNRTEDATVGRNIKLLPPPRDVAYNAASATDVHWDAPDMENAWPAAVTDDFESYGNYIPDDFGVFPDGAGFATEAGDWVFVDVDRHPIGGIVSSSTWEMIEFPGIPVHSAQSWWVQSRFFEEFNNDYYGHSGMQYLANMYVVNDTFTAGEAQDDWAVSPELCGEEQLISVWARSYNRSTPETIELLWSDGSTDPEDFILARRLENISAEWTEYVFVVPQGARRFAVRGCSYAPMGTSQTFVDDVTFVPANGEKQSLTLLGYNVYRDNERLNVSPVNGLSHPLADDFRQHVYAVSAVYAEGESRAVVMTEGAGVEAAPDRLSIRGGRGVITISGLEGSGYMVADVSGKVVARGEGADSASPAVAAGVYTVTVANRTVKVVVR